VDNGAASQPWLGRRRDLDNLDLAGRHTARYFSREVGCDRT
jgi:hypothetical protein